MSRPELVVIGAGGHARACIDVIEQQGEFEVAGLTGLSDELGSEHLGYRVIATDAQLQELANRYQYALVAVGQIDSPDKRIRLFKHVCDIGFGAPVIVAPTAYVSRHAVVGAGTIVMHGAIVNAGARIGTNCIVNSRALIEHDAIVGDHCHISTGAILNGAVRVGAQSFVGSGTAVKQGVALGARCVIGMGLCVRHDQGDGSVFVGQGQSHKTTVAIQ